MNVLEVEDEIHLAIKSGLTEYHQEIERKLQSLMRAGYRMQDLVLVSGKVPDEIRSKALAGFSLTASGHVIGQNFIVFRSDLE